MADTHWLVAYVFNGTQGKGAGTGRAFAAMYREGIPSSKDLISWEKQIMENDPSLGKVGITNFQQIEALQEEQP